MLESILLGASLQLAIVAGLVLAGAFVLLRR